jgi:hypothetical protein
VRASLRRGADFLPRVALGLALAIELAGCAGSDAPPSRALSYAEAGVEEAIARVSDMADTALYIGQPMLGWVDTPGWGRYLVPAPGLSAEDPEAAATEQDSLDNDGDGLVDEALERYPEVLSQGAGAAPYCWVKVRYRTDDLRRVILFGDGDLDLETPPGANAEEGLPILMITARGEDDGVARTLLVEAARPALPVAAAAIYTEVDSVKFNGTAFLVSGYDWDPTTGEASQPYGNLRVPGVLTTGRPSRIKVALKANQRDNVEGKGAAPSVDSSRVDLDLTALAEEWAERADLELSGAGNPAIPPAIPERDRIVHVTGDYAPPEGTRGSGILVVDGRLSLTSQFTWTGVVLVNGSAQVVGAGAGIHIYGTLVVSGGGEPLTVGGNADVLYSSPALQRVAALFPYAVLNRQEF